MDIQYGIACGPQSDKFLDCLIENILQTASAPENIELLLGINSSTDVAKVNLIIKKYYKRIKITRVYCDTRNKQPSGIHGKTLDDILQMMTASIGIFSDCDIMFLMKDWDKILLKQLSGTNIVIGTEYSKRLNKYHQFPNAIFCMFYPNILKELCISMLPHENMVLYNTIAKKQNINITKDNAAQFGCDFVDQDNLHIYPGHEVGHHIILDTGFELNKKIQQSKYTGIPLNYSYEKVALAQINDMAIQEFNFNGIPIITHLKNGKKIINRSIFDEWIKGINSHINK